jgi:hypothetical protein
LVFGQPIYFSRKCVGILVPPDLGELASSLIPTIAAYWLSNVLAAVNTPELLNGPDLMALAATLFVGDRR